MAKVCDHTSVGMLVKQEGKILLIERKKGTLGFALPAGHVDTDSSYEAAATRELAEEVGLTAISLTLLIEGRKENPCHREGGSWHYWKIYTVETKGELRRSESETKQALWYTLEEIKELAHRTEKYLKSKILEGEWAEKPGLEPVMYDWFTDLHII